MTQPSRDSISPETLWNQRAENSLYPTESRPARLKRNILIGLVALSALGIIGATLFFMRGDLQTVMSILTQRMDMPIWKCATLIGGAGAGIGFISALAIPSIKADQKKKRRKEALEKFLTFEAPDYRFPEANVRHRRT